MDVDERAKSDAEVGETFHLLAHCIRYEELHVFLSLPTKEFIFFFSVDRYHLLVIDEYECNP